MKSLFVFIAIPIISMPESEQVYNITELEGDSSIIIIPCTATGYPVPDVVWLNSDGSVVDENRIHRIMNTGIGNLFNVSALMIIGRNDAGAYTCIANNSIGNVTHTINITINCKE